MSNHYALQFLGKTIQDKTLLDKVQQVTGISGDFILSQISDEQYSAVSRLGKQEGYDFSGFEIKSVFENLIDQQTNPNATPTPTPAPKPVAPKVVEDLQMKKAIEVLTDKAAAAKVG